MLYIDSVILNMIERACRKFQRLTGRTNVWLALQLTNLSIVMYFLWAAVAFAGAETWLQIFVGVFCAALLFVLIKTLFKESIEAYENSTFRRVLKGLKNPRRVRDALLRVAFLTLAAVLWYPALLVYVNLHLQALLLAYPLIVLTTAVLYLVACDPLPPSAETVEERGRRPVAAPALSPEES
jgi:hypothetical protein